MRRFSTFSPPNCTDFHMQWDNSGWSMLITIYSLSLIHSFLHIQQVPIFSMSCLTPLCIVWGNQLTETDYAEIQKAWPVYLHLPDNKEARGFLLLNIIIFIAPESWAATLDNLFPEFRYIGINRLVTVIRKQTTNGQCQAHCLVCSRYTVSVVKTWIIFLNHLDTNR